MLSASRGAECIRFNMKTLEEREATVIDRVYKRMIRKYSEDQRWPQQSWCLSQCEVCFGGKGLHRKQTQLMASMPIDYDRPRDWMISKIDIGTNHSRFLLHSRVHPKIWRLGVATAPHDWIFESVSPGLTIFVSNSGGFSFISPISNATRKRLTRL